jgi:hypothetical protein
VSMDTLATSLGRLTKAQAAALKDTSQQARVFEALGIAIKGADGGLRNSAEVFADFADKFKALQGSPEAMAAGFALFGRSFQDLVPLLKDGGDGLRAAGDELERLGGVLSTEAGQQAEQFNDDLERLKVAAQGLFMQIARELLPKLNELTAALVESAEKGDLARNVADVLGAAFSGAASLLSGYEKAVRLTTLAMENATVVAGSWYQIQKNILSLGFAEGTVADGLDRISRQRAASEREKAEILGGRKPSGPPVLFAGRDAEPTGFFRNPAAVGVPDAGKLRLALGGGAKKAKKEGKSDAEKEAERLAEAYKRLEDSLKEQIALHGETTEVAKLRYELENGELAKLTKGQKDHLLGLAEQRDAQIEAEKVAEDGKQLTESLLTPTEELNKLREEAAKLLEAGAIAQETYNRAIESYKEPGQQMLEDLQFELELLRMTNAERATAIQLRGMDAEQVRKYGDEIAAANQKIEDSMKQIELMDGIRGEMEDLFVSLVDGSKSAGDALKAFFDNIAAMITRMIAEKWVEQLFGQKGTAGGGASGDGWGQAIGAFFGLFGGGRANGGPVSGGTQYLVGERGPELFVPRTAGAIVPAGQTARMVGGGGATLNQTFVVQGAPDRRTREQMARDSGRAARRGMARTG